MCCTRDCWVNMLVRYFNISYYREKKKVHISQLDTTPIWKNLFHYYIIFWGWKSEYEIHGKRNDNLLLKWISVKCSLGIIRTGIQGPLIIPFPIPFQTQKKFRQQKYTNVSMLDFRFSGQWLWRVGLLVFNAM